ncbi:hypothetical protein FOZ60_014696 [Perkinsus olseni]|uniref:Uncharacterized protein n=1 Tax=Perkinsus olseni TaxID=32597 RepID=A0A7J6PMU0_PEROL|nr:hypothetical protein FOZ60_014696 [Perkinsus olseni]
MLALRTLPIIFFSITTTASDIEVVSPYPRPKEISPPDCYVKEKVPVSAIKKLFNRPRESTAYFKYDDGLVISSLDCADKKSGGHTLFKREDAAAGHYRQPLPRLTVNRQMDPLKSELAQATGQSDRCIAAVKASYRDLQEKGDLEKDDQRFVSYLCTVTKESYDVRHSLVMGRGDFRALPASERARRSKLPMHLRFVDS